MVEAATSLVGAFLVTLVAFGVVLLVPLSSSNRAIAVGDVFGAGIFLLAIVAAVVAILAYAQSSRQPSLTTSWEFWSRRHGFWILLDNEFPRDLGPRELTDDLPGPQELIQRLPDDVSDLVPLAPVLLNLTLQNDGEVAARNVAILFRLEGIYFNPPPKLDPGSSWKFLPGDYRGWRVQWEGGTDRPVYPGFSRTPTIELTGMWASAGTTHSNWGAVITVADDREQPDMRLLKIKVAQSSAPAAV